MPDGASIAGRRKSCRPDQIIEIVYRGAVDVLRSCSTEHGLKASALANGHREVWARDSMIAALGGTLINDEAVRTAMRDSVATLRRHQTPLGAIPNHVEPVSARTSFRAYADGGLWFVIGASILAPDLTSIGRVLRWYEYQDVDSSGVLSMQEASDWQDFFCVRGKTLYLNCLYVAALRRAAGMAADPSTAESWRARSDAVARKVNELFWYRGDGDTLRHVSHSFSTPDSIVDSLGRIRQLPSKRLLVEEQYYLPYLGFREIGEWFDTFGHLMAILSGVADETQAARALDFMERHGLADHPAKSIYPAVQPGDPDWRDYYGSLNLPHQYHNGGVWPFLGGLYVAALVKAGRRKAAQKALHRLALVNSHGNFNEWHHGETLEPMGVECQAWSAAMFVYARECVHRKTAIFFD